MVYMFFVGYSFHDEYINPMVIDANSYVDAAKNYIAHPKNKETMEYIVDPESFKLNSQNINSFLVPSFDYEVDEETGEIDLSTIESHGIKPCVFPFGIRGWKVDVADGESLHIILCEWLLQHIQNMLVLPSGTLLDEEKAVLRLEKRYRRLCYGTK